MPIINITDYAAAFSKPELELYISNRENKLMHYYEPEPGIFIAESRNVVELALDSGYTPISAIITENMLSAESNGRSLIAGLLRDFDISIYVVDISVAKEFLGYYLPGGICCAMRRSKTPVYPEFSAGIRSRLGTLDTLRRVVVLDDVENPTNVGAILRSAAAFGIDAILLSPACADPLYRRSLRVSVGNAFLVPWTYICRSENEWENRGITILQEAGFKTVALALREDNIDIDDPRLKNEKKTALVMGNEGYGLTDRTINACDYVAKIPMCNGVDSLNVAVAAGIAMWEITR